MTLDSRIEGFWSGPDLGTTAEISRQDSTYFVTYRDKTDSTSIVAEGRLFTAGKYSFLDITQADFLDDLGNAPRHLWLTIRTHLFFKVSFIADSLIIVGINEDWFESFLESDSCSLDFVEREDSILLTSSSTDIQTFLATHATNPICFSDSSVFVRKNHGFGGAQ